MLSPRDQCFLHTLLPCIIMSTNINTRVSAHTRAADMARIVSFQPSVVSGCSKPAAKSAGKIKLHQLWYPPLTVQRSSLAGQTNQRPDVLFCMGRVRWAADGWFETSGSLLRAMSLTKARVVCLRRGLQAQVIGQEEKSPATSRCAAVSRASILCSPPSPGCQVALGGRKCGAPHSHVCLHTHPCEFGGLRRIRNGFAML